jgi:hypothetical protein
MISNTETMKWNFVVLLPTSSTKQISALLPYYTNMSGIYLEVIFIPVKSNFNIFTPGEGSKFINMTSQKINWQNSLQICKRYQLSLNIFYSRDGSKQWNDTQKKSASVLYPMIQGQRETSYTITQICQAHRQKSFVSQFKLTKFWFLDEGQIH